MSSPKSHLRVQPLRTWSQRVKKWLPRHIFDVFVTMVSSPIRKNAWTRNGGYCNECSVFIFNASSRFLSGTMSDAFLSFPNFRALPFTLTFTTRQRNRYPLNIGFVHVSVAMAIFRHVNRQKHRNLNFIEFLTCIYGIANEVVTKSMQRGTSHVVATTTDAIYAMVIRAHHAVSDRKDCRSLQSFSPFLTLLAILLCICLLLRQLEGMPKGTRSERALRIVFARRGHCIHRFGTFA